MIGRNSSRPGQCELFIPAHTRCMERSDALQVNESFPAAECVQDMSGCAVANSAAGAPPLRSRMAIADDVAQQQARLEKMLAEFQAAQRRRLVKQGIALWNETEAASAAVSETPPPPTKAN